MYLGLAGEGAGEAARRLLYGLQAPCGRLAETWPVRLSDTPAWHHFPMGPRSVSYNESIYIGYRYYDKAGASVAFPFGYGLSYTTFAYSGLHLSAEKLARHEALEVSFRVRNTGARAGARNGANLPFAHGLLRAPAGAHPGGLCPGGAGAGRGGEDGARDGAAHIV